MAATAQDVIDTLRSIDKHLASLVAHFGAGVTHGASAAPAGQNTVPTIASDRDLDSQYGNPEVKAKSPRDWTGADMKGKRFSECPPEYLDLVASRLDYFAEQNAGSQDSEEQKKARYNRIDASRARGWAARIRAGWKPPAMEAFDGTAPATMGAPSTFTDEDIPF